MESLADEIKNWTTSFDENLNILLITFDDTLVNSLVDVLYTIDNCVKIVLSNKYLDYERKKNTDGISDIERKYPNKIISTLDYGKNPEPCLFFGDFVDTTSLTTNSIDYYMKVDREDVYRKNCRSVMMYKMSGVSPVNGYWHTDRPTPKGTNIVILNLSEWGAMCQNIPDTSGIIAARHNIGNVEVGLKWIDKLKNYLRYILTEIAGNDQYVEEMINDENMECWKKVFTHKTYNQVVNYELLEFFGDKISSAYFSIYMITKYPRLTNHEASEYHNQYLSSDHQHYMANDLHLMDFLLIDEDLKSELKNFNYEKRKTDLIESFVGAVYNTAVNAVTGLTGKKSKGSSFANFLLTNFFTMVGESLPFEKKMTHGKSKHRVTQILESLGFQIKVDFDENVENRNNGTVDAINVINLFLSERLKQYIENLKTNTSFVVNKDLSILKKISYEYSPHDYKKEFASNVFWGKIAKIFDDNGIDLIFAKENKENFLSYIHIIDSELYQKVTSKLSLTFPGKNIDELINHVQFTSENEPGDISYVTMYINTFIAEPNSKLLKTFSETDNISNKAADDYFEESKCVLQIINPASVPLPKEFKYINNYKLIPINLGRYYACQKYVNS